MGGWVESDRRGGREEKASLCYLIHDTDDERRDTGDSFVLTEAFGSKDASREDLRAMDECRDRCE